ncbi:MAG: YjbH domain-containing protein [Alphaproteobacteria bacterium]|nr:YjbH domain-containing protein [Alphaproteobacteria bacterium]
MRARRLVALALCAAIAFAAPPPGHAQAPDAPARIRAPATFWGGPVIPGDYPSVPWASPNDFGQTGLLQMPDARFLPDGTAAMGVSHVHPYNRLFLTAQVLPVLEATFRYTDITNRLYGAAAFSGDQSFKDRSIDLKFRLLAEGPYWPQIAVGLRDLGGTALFGSEYVVASRRFWDFDLTLGIGWGNMATRGAMPNPLGLGWRRLRERPRAATPGSLRFSFFRGREVGLFGGVSWATPIPGLALKLEYDSNDYQSEALDNRLRVAAPVNAGLVWRPVAPVELGLGIERGNAVMARASLILGLHERPGITRNDPPPPAIAAPPAAPAQAQGQAQGQESAPLAAALAPALAEHGILLRGLAVGSTRAEARIANTRFAEMPQAIGRAARILAARLPPGVGEIVIAIVEQGVVVNRIALLRGDMLRAATGRGSAEEVLARARFGTDVPLLDAPIQDLAALPRLRWGVSPAWRQSVGGPEGFYLWQLSLRGEVEVELAPGLFVAGVASQNLANNFDRLRIPSDSVLPRVRSDVKEYLRQGTTAIANLQLDWFGRLGEGLYARATLGWLEPMFAGLGGELLWKPEGASWALGASLHYVRQRAFDGGLGLRGYGVATGHLTWYQSLPFWNLELAVSAGRYLAGDWGGTVEISRRFDSGIRIGAWATKTNVSARDFGEGAFDKGFFIAVPLDLFFTRSTREVAEFSFRPLSRDGGQRLAERRTLYGIVAAGDRMALGRGWSRLME